MKLTSLFTSVAIAAVGVNGLAPDRQVVITYPNETPKHVLDDAKASIIAAVSSLSNLAKNVDY